MNVGRQVVAARATTMPFPARSSDDDEDDGRRENEAAEEATPRMMVGDAVRRRGRWRMVTSMISNGELWRLWRRKLLVAIVKAEGEEKRRSKDAMLPAILFRLLLWHRRAGRLTDEFASEYNELSVRHIQ